MSCDLSTSKENTLSLFATLLGTASVNGTDGAPSTSPLLNNVISLDSNDEIVCSFPSLDLLASRSPLSSIMKDDRNPNTELSGNIKNIAALNLGKPTQTTDATIQMTPSIILRNFVSSFSYLVDSRIRAWTLKLLKHSLATGDDQSRARVLALLSISSSVSLGAIVTSFTALPTDKSWRKSVSHPETSIPVEFEGIIDVSIQGRVMTVKTKAKGSIYGSFAPPYNKLLDRVAIQIDTAALLKSMMDEASRVVLKVVTNASIHPGVVALGRKASKQAAIARLNSMVRSNASLSEMTRPITSNFLPKDISSASFRRRVSFTEPIEKKRRNTSVSVSSFLHLKKKRKQTPSSILMNSQRISEQDLQITRNASFAEFGSSRSSQIYSHPLSKGVRDMKGSPSVDGLLLLANAGSLYDSTK